MKADIRPFESVSDTQLESMIAKLLAISSEHGFSPTEYEVFMQINWELRFRALTCGRPFFDHDA